MPEPKGVQQPAPTHQPIGTRVKRAGLAVLFSAVLLIPRIRRLRRRVWAWTIIRLLAVTLGAWLIWHYGRGSAEITLLVAGIALVGFGMLVSARRETISSDSVAQELSALVVLNGSAFLASNGTRSIPEVNIFVNPERLTVLTTRHQPVAEIPLAALQRLSVHPAGEKPENKVKGGAWEIEISWESGEAHTASFHYEGFFAEHLARVAEQTIASLWKKGLPVLK